MTVQTRAIIKQIDAVLKRYTELRSRSKYDDCSDQPTAEVTAVITIICSAIERLSGPESQHVKSMRTIIQKYRVDNAYVVPHLVGVIKALRSDYKAGYLSSIAELVHADIFTDFLQMAEYLLTEGYKDPAAVIAGSVLEEHLRQLSIKQGIALLISGKPKKADTLNGELSAQSAYSKLDLKSVTAWLDLRNKAAHGKYTEYTKAQVELLIQGVRNFMARVPA